MYKIGVIGDQDSIMGFLSLGIDIFAVNEAEEIKRTIHKLANESYNGDGVSSGNGSDQQI